MASLSQAQLLEYVVSKVAGAQATFKVNKLQQLLAALVKQSFVLPACNAAKKVRGE